MNVQDYLRRQRVPFDVLPHRTTFTAQRMAHTLDVPGDNVAKTVVVESDDHFALMVLQASHFVDMPKARQALSAASIKLAMEDDLSDLFPDCELGAVPPFGSRYEMETVVDESLSHDDYIVFEGNCHDEAISMRYGDFAAIEQPTVADFTRHL